jgi:hypothetical protein
MKNQFTWYRLTRSEKKHNENGFFCEGGCGWYLLDQMPDGNKRHNILNETTLKGN